MTPNLDLLAGDFGQFIREPCHGIIAKVAGHRHVGDLNALRLIRIRFVLPRDLLQEESALLVDQVTEEIYDDGGIVPGKALLHRFLFRCRGNHGAGQKLLQLADIVDISHQAFQLFPVLRKLPVLLGQEKNRPGILMGQL